MHSLGFYEEHIDLHIINSGLNHVLTSSRGGSTEQGKSVATDARVSEPQNLEKTFEGATAGMAAMKLPEEGIKAEQQGTREQYVKSTGVGAEGGNLNASKVGAAKEADRMSKSVFKREMRNVNGVTELLAEKGVSAGPGETSSKDAGLEKRTEGTKLGDTSSSPAPAGSRDTSTGTDTKKEKLSLKDKIKAKLHKHKD